MGGRKIWKRSACRGWKRIGELYPEAPGRPAAVGAPAQGSGSTAALFFVEAAAHFTSGFGDSAAARTRRCGEEAAVVPAMRAGGFLEAGGPIAGIGEYAL